MQTPAGRQDSVRPSLLAVAQAHRRCPWLADLAGAWVFYSVLPLPPGHRFPMAKYALLRERLATSGSLRRMADRIAAVVPLTRELLTTLEAADLQLEVLVEKPELAATH